VENGRVFEIEDIQTAERAGLPPTLFLARGFLSNLLLYLILQKVTEMFPEELFKLFQVAIAVERASAVCLAVILPTREELL
jgi:hypothetical protein